MTDNPPWIIASHPERPIDADAVLRLFAQPGWWLERTAAQMAEVIERGPSVGAWVAGRLVGFARAVDDGAFRAYVEDVVVDEPLRRNGIAHALVERLLALVPPGAVVSLFSSPALTPVYSGLGFTGTKQVVMHLTLGRRLADRPPCALPTDCPSS